MQHIQRLNCQQEKPMIAQRKFFQVHDGVTAKASRTKCNLKSSLYLGLGYMRWARQCTVRISKGETTRYYVVMLCSLGG